MTNIIYYPKWAKYRRDNTSVKPKTIFENANDWRRFYEGTELVNLPLSSLTPLILTRFFRNLTKDRSLTARNVSNARGVLNGIFSYSIEEGILESNPLKEVNFKDFDYKSVEDQINNVFNKDDVDRLLTYLETKGDEPYYLAIRLFFNLFIRIGEFKALSWSDINWDDRTIYVHKQLLTERDLNDDMTFSSRGVRVSN